MHHHSGLHGHPESQVGPAAHQPGKSGQKISSPSINCMCWFSYAELVSTSLVGNKPLCFLYCLCTKTIRWSFEVCLCGWCLQYQYTDLASKERAHFTQEIDTPTMDHSRAMKVVCSEVSPLNSLLYLSHQISFGGGHSICKLGV